MVAEEDLVDPMAALDPADTVAEEEIDAIEAMVDVTAETVAMVAADGTSISDRWETAPTFSFYFAIN